MAIARTGVYVDDYLEYSSTLSAELQRLLSTMRELDERAQGFISLTRDQTKYYVGMHSQSSKKASYEDDETELEKMKKEVEDNQENALSLCTEKVLLAKQAYYLIESHMKRLDEDLNQFAEDLKQDCWRLIINLIIRTTQVFSTLKNPESPNFRFLMPKIHLDNFVVPLEGKIPEDEPAVLPPLPIVIREEKRKGGHLTPQLKRTRERDWGRERNMDLELMPPPGSHKKSIVAAVDVDLPIDPNEPTYCVCNQVSFGDMIACDNENCEGGEWFHYSCVGLTPETRFKGKWFCPTCRLP